MRRIHQILRDMIVLPLFAALMVVSKLALDILPNIHLIAMFSILLTRFYRVKALIPIYLFVLIDGIIEGFFPGVWVMHCYIWLILWLWVMLLPKNLPQKVEIFIYPLLGMLHGALFGILSFPATYLMFIPKSAWGWKSAVVYIASGLPYDMIHAFSNLCACMLVLPLLNLMRMMQKKKNL